MDPMVICNPLVLSLSSLPALKCGMYLAGTFTGPPVFGLRPVRDGL